MTLHTTEANAPKIDESTLAGLAKRTGDIWSVLLPATHPGAGEGSKLSMLRSLAHALEVKPQTAWLERMEQHLAEPGLKGGGPGLALYAGDDFVESYAAEITRPQIAQGNVCYVVPLLREVQMRHEFFILGLSKKLVRWLRYERGVCQELELPEDMPESLADFHSEDERVNLGSGGSRNQEDQHLQHFFLAVDNAVGKVAGKQKVLLMGVAEELAMFRRTSKHLQMFDEQIASGLRSIGLSEIAQVGGACVVDEQRAEEKKALHRIHEWPDRSLVEEDLERVVVCATGGQVDELCLKESSGASGLASEKEVLANSAAVETLRHRGRVHVVREEDMTAHGEAVALLRF